MSTLTRQRESRLRRDISAILHVIIYTFCIHISCIHNGPSGPQSMSWPHLHSCLQNEVDDGDELRMCVYKQNITRIITYMYRNLTTPRFKIEPSLKSDSALVIRRWMFLAFLWSSLHTLCSGSCFNPSLRHRVQNNKSMN